MTNSVILNRTDPDPKPEKKKKSCPGGNGKIWTFFQCSPVHPNPGPGTQPRNSFYFLYGNIKKTVHRTKILRQKKVRDKQTKKTHKKQSESRTYRQRSKKIVCNITTILFYKNKEIQRGVSLNIKEIIVE